MAVGAAHTQKTSTTSPVTQGTVRPKPAMGRRASPPSKEVSGKSSGSAAGDAAGAGASAKEAHRLAAEARSPALADIRSEVLDTEQCYPAYREETPAGRALWLQEQLNLAAETDLQQTVVSGDRVRFERLLSESSHTFTAVSNANSPGKMTALHLAAALNDLWFADRLIAVGLAMNVVSLMSKRLFEFCNRQADVDPLHLAMLLGYDEMVERLVRAGARPTSAPDSQYIICPLHYLFLGPRLNSWNRIQRDQWLRGLYRVLQVLIERGYDNNNGIQPRLLRGLLVVLNADRLSQERLDAVSLLLYVGIGTSRWVVEYTRGALPLHLVCYHYKVQSDLVHVLLTQKAEVQLRTEDDGGDTPLHCALRHIDTMGEAAVQTLMEHGPDLDVMNKNAKTPRQLLAKKKRDVRNRLLAAHPSKGAWPAWNPPAGSSYVWKKPRRGDLIIKDMVQRIGIIPAEQ
ncbi:hypothetical protein LTR65_011054 [Meristemomyces frigidus]